MIAEKKKYAIDLINQIPDSNIDNIIIYLQDILLSDKFNADTIAAINEVEDIEKNPENYKSYKNAEEMIKDILNSWNMI